MASVTPASSPFFPLNLCVPLSAHHPGHCPWVSSGAFQGHSESPALGFEPGPNFSPQIWHLQPSVWRAGCPGRDFSITQHKCFLGTQMFSCLSLLGVDKLPSFDASQHVPHPFWHFHYVLFTLSRKLKIGAVEAFQDIFPQIAILCFEPQPDSPYG